MRLGATHTVSLSEVREEARNSQLSKVIKKKDQSTAKTPKNCYLGKNGKRQPKNIC